MLRWAAEVRPIWVAPWPAVRGSFSAAASQGQAAGYAVMPSDPYGAYAAFQLVQPIQGSPFFPNETPEQRRHLDWRMSMHRQQHTPTTHMAKGWWSDLDAINTLTVMKQKTEEGEPIDGMALKHLYKLATSPDDIKAALDITAKNRALKSNRHQDIPAVTPTSTLNTLLESCKRNQAYEEAVECLERVHELGFPVSNSVFHNTMKWVVHRDPHLIVRSFNAMKEAGAKPTRATAFHVIRALASMQAVEAAQHAAREFLQNGITFTSTTERILRMLTHDEFVDSLYEEFNLTSSASRADSPYADGSGEGSLVSELKPPSLSGDSESENNSVAAAN